MSTSDNRHKIWAIGVAVLLFILIGMIGLFGRQKTVSPYEVFSHIQTRVEGTGLSPDFVYAIAFAESSLRKGVETVHARGIMQISRAAWEDMSDKPYRMACNWRTNINVGVDYLYYCKRVLDSRGKFSYPLLAAAYRYGPNAVIDADYNLDNLPKPRNATYQKLFKGNIPTFSE